jgi:hypothetical protein
MSRTTRPLPLVLRNALMHRRVTAGYYTSARQLGATSQAIENLPLQGSALVAGVGSLSSTVQPRNSITLVEGCTALRSNR